MAEIIPRKKILQTDMLEQWFRVLMLVTARLLYFFFMKARFQQYVQFGSLPNRCSWMETSTI